MNIEDNRTKTIFRNENNGKVNYRIGLNKRNQDGTYTSGYMSCKFPSKADIPNKTKIKIVDAWLDFWVDDKKATHTYIFINKYEILENENSNDKPLEEINDDELPY